MPYEAKNFERLLGVGGLSDQILKNHFALYQGYVANTNKLIELLSEMLKEEKDVGPDFAELKRRIGWEFDGMRLHEYYFENISKGGAMLNLEAKLNKKIVENFGSYMDWEKDFKAVGAMRGIGWVILCYDPIEKKLFNVWINEHDGGHFVGTCPLLVMDVFEHAYMLDYGIKRADYIAAFFKVIDWGMVAKRFEAAV